MIPSIPGYGYSGKPATTGWGPERIAGAWVELMKRLGYTQFAAQGGDWGAVIVDLMAVQKPAGLLGIHTNMPGIFPAEIDAAAFSGAPAPAGLSADEKFAYERLQYVYQKGIAYGFQMGLRPQTLYGIADSPVGLAAYFLDHDLRSYELIRRVFDGQAEGLTRDDVLDNITIAWLTNTAISGARLYWEYFGKGYFNVKGVTIPVAVSVFLTSSIRAAELDRESVSQAAPLQRAPERRALRGVGAAGVLLPGGPRRAAVASLDCKRRRVRRPTLSRVKIAAGVPVPAAVRLGP